MSFLTRIASTSRTVDDFAYEADGGSDVPPTTADDRHAFSYAARGPYEEAGLVAESTPSSPRETDDRYAKLDMNTEKSPISIINEFMLSHGEQIHYHLISTKGTIHCPEFTYSLTYNNVTIYGSGNSKKEAKKNTAIAFLKKFECINNTKTSTTFNTLFSPINNNHEVKTVAIKPKLNYIGILQELCMSRRWELPKYEFCQKEFSEDNWSVLCFIQLFKSKGEDKSKQTAKNKSAYFMYEYIKGLSQEEITFINYHENQIINNYNKSIINMTELEKCISPDIRVKMFFNLFKSKKPFINNLKICKSISEFRMSSVDILKKIGEEEGFNVIYDFNFVNISKKFEVFVKLSLTPILTHMCSGNAIQETQEAVAFDVLSYFKSQLTN